MNQPLTTANLFFALPRIARPPGGLDRLAFLMMGQRGLVELDAAPDGPAFLASDVLVGGDSVLASAGADSIDDWIPRFETRAANYTASSTWLAPADFRGVVLRLLVRNTADTSLSVRLIHRLNWARTRVATYCPEDIEGRLALDPDGWGGGIGLAFVTYRTLFALGVGCSENASMRLTTIPRGDAPAIDIDPRLGTLRRFEPGTALRLEVTRDVLLSAGETATLDLFVSVGMDRKSGPLHARYLADLGFDHLLDHTRQRIRQLNAGVPEALGDDARLGPLVRRNRLFCYYYSLGRTLDTDELCPVTSRSGDYYVSAGYWDRDSLLWGFPTILDMDVETAGRMLVAAFGRQGRNIGIHSRFIDGSVCEPGFELDELCAPFIALDAYLRHTGDWTVLDRIDLDAAIRRVRSELKRRKHPEIDLFSTEYLPTDDLAVHPYCIYDNVLVWVMCGTLRRIAEHHRDISAQWWAQLRERVHDAVWSYGVTVESGQKLFAWSTDLRGGFRLYDEPPGSLTLLAWYGFCSYDDPIYKSTCGWIYSTRNEHYFESADEIGCLHERHPWILAAANSLLAPRRADSALALLSRCDMDAGFACETVDEHTGTVVSGRHFATCAGFLCHALTTAFRRRLAGKCYTFATQFTETARPAPRV